ncbi:MAG: nicotinate-nucleotide--dimethylbenzimidazole phosphoribosyltransferase, partial [Mailhella sp.]
MFRSFQELCSALAASDKSLLAVAQNHLNNLTKPVGSLGRLEEFAAKLFTIYQGKFPFETDPALHVLAAADHGVYAEGVAQNPQEVTHLMICLLNTS